MKEREITHLKTMTNTGEVSSGIIGKREERWKWRQIAPCATENLKWTEKQTCKSVE